MSQPTPHEERNPYCPPKATEGLERKESLFFSFEGDTPETLRSTYLAHEATVKAIGLYLYLMAGASLLNLVHVFASTRLIDGIASRMPATSQTPESIRIMLVAAGLFGALFNAALGYFLRRLQNWARWIVIVSSGFGTLGLAQVAMMTGGRPNLEIATSILYIIINIYIIYTLFTGDNAIVFSPRYRDAVAETPQSVRLHARDRLFLGIAAIGFLVGFIYRFF